MKQFIVTCGIIPQTGECKFGEKCSPKMCPAFVHNLSDKQKIVEIIKHHVSHITYNDDEYNIEHRFVGKAENGKYFYLWGKKYIDKGLIPIINIENEDSGIMYFNNIENAIEVFNIIEFSEKGLLDKIKLSSGIYKSVVINQDLYYLNTEDDEIRVLRNKNMHSLLCYNIKKLYYESYLILFIKLKYNGILV